MRDEQLEKLEAEDHDERDLRSDWTQAKHSIKLRLDKEVIAFFKAGGKGHISRMPIENQGRNS